MLIEATLLSTRRTSVLCRLTPVLAKIARRWERAVLRRMLRRYRRSDFLAVVERLRRALPAISRDGEAAPDNQ